MVRKYGYLLLSLLLLISCAPEIDFPEVIYNSNLINNEDTYRHISPDIMLPLGAGASDVFVGPGARVFVAAPDLNEVLIYDWVGNRVELNHPEVIQMDSVCAVAVDDQMNLVMVNGTNQLRIWNILLDDVNPVRVIHDFQVRYIPQDTVLTVNAQQYRNLILNGLGGEDWEEVGVSVQEIDAAGLDTLIAPRDFEVGGVTHQYLDVEASPTRPGYLFLSDYAFGSTFDRINEVTLNPWAMVITDDADLDTLYLWEVEDYRRIIDRGTGLGYLDGPRRLTFDDAGDMYYSLARDTENQFLVHKVEEWFVGTEYAYYPPQEVDFDNQQIYLRSTFQEPRGLTVSEQNIYVADSGLKGVLVFSGSGELQTYVGAEVSWEDTLVYDYTIENGDTLSFSVDTLVVPRYDFNMLEEPISVSYFTGGSQNPDLKPTLFVLDRAAGSLLRFENVFY